IGLVLLEAGANVAFARLPRRFEFPHVALWTITPEKIGVAPDPRRDEIVRRLPKDRSPLHAVALQQSVCAPALQPRRQLPSQVDDVLQPVVEPEAAIRRMTVRCIACNEHATLLVLLCDCHPHVPE